jgi:hypothetical protein
LNAPTRLVRSIFSCKNVKTLRRQSRAERSEKLETAGLTLKAEHFIAAQDLVARYWIGAAGVLGHAFSAKSDQITFGVPGRRNPDVVMETTSDAVPRKNCQLLDNLATCNVTRNAFENIHFVSFYLNQV